MFNAAYLEGEEQEDFWKSRSIYYGDSITIIGSLFFWMSLDPSRPFMLYDFIKAFFYKHDISLREKKPKMVKLLKELQTDIHMVKNINYRATWQPFL